MDTYNEIIEKTIQFLDEKFNKHSNPSRYGIPAGYTLRVINNSVESYKNFVAIYEKVLARVNLNKEDYLTQIKLLSVFACNVGYYRVDALTKSLKYHLTRTTSKVPVKLKNTMISVLQELNTDVPDSEVGKYVEGVFSAYFNTHFYTNNAHIFNHSRRPDSYRYGTSSDFTDDIK